MILDLLGVDNVAFLQVSCFHFRSLSVAPCERCWGRIHIIGQDGLAVVARLVVHLPHSHVEHCGRVPVSEVVNIVGRFLWSGQPMVYAYAYAYDMVFETQSGQIVVHEL